MTQTIRTDTIYALATPPGRSGVAVVRVSGPAAGDSLQSMLANNKLPKARQAHLAKLYDPASLKTRTARVIDQALVLYFESPNSYTGEDVVEYHLHGSPAVIEDFLGVLANATEHRMAERGEFTRRAFDNDKMDLTAAEAVADLIDAETSAQKDQALSQLGGNLRALYEGWAESLTRALAHLEADLDFPDEDLPEGVADQVWPQIERVRSEINIHLSDNHRGERLRNGIKLAVIGAPNAGKSSLVNMLAKRDVAITSEVAGTTRDVLEVHLDIGGYPVIVSDTAGLKPELIAHDNPDLSGHDKIEAEGIKRALAVAQNADFKLLMFDATSLPDPATLELAGNISLIIINKADTDELATQAEQNMRTHLTKDVHPVMISLLHETGTDTLISRLQTIMKEQVGSISEAPSLTRARHRDALIEALDALTRAVNAPLPELVTEDVRLAVRALGRITGKVDVEDLLDLIFSEFCIGK